jgi:BirA family biotin operon repressor/biotin-[acetyl-CoA-carboxylase] ligase
MIPRQEWHLETQFLGRRVLVFERLDSTNTLAAALADDPANNGIVIVAEEQTAGRGQHGRTWNCEQGMGLLLSVLVFPPPVARRPVILAAWAANAVCDMICRTTGLQAKIKWPNDVLIRGHKVCGILIEQGRGTVVGIGLNLNQTAESFAAAGLPQAGSLALFTGRSFECAAMARLLIVQLDEAYQRFCAGDFERIENLWKRRIALAGRQVLIECHDAVYRGRLRDLAFDGLVLDVSGGETVHLLPESIRHLMPA